MGMFRYTWKSFFREIVLLVVAIFFCVPLYLLCTISLKDPAAAYVSPLSFPTSPNWSSYTDALHGAGGSSGVGHALVSSLIITISSVVCLILLGSIASYAIGRRQGKLSGALYITFILGILIPAQLGLVPLYVLMRNLHLVNSYIGVIILYTALLMPLTVFLITGFVRALPRDYEEAAQVDGASQIRTFFRVVMPLLMPIIGTVAVITGLLVWNDFFLQLVFLGGSDIETLPVAVYALAGANVAQWNVIFAAVAISLAPVLAFFFFAQRTMVRGFSGGVRG